MLYGFAYLVVRVCCCLGARGRTLVADKWGRHYIIYDESLNIIKAGDSESGFQGQF